MNNPVLSQRKKVEKCFEISNLSNDDQESESESYRKTVNMVMNSGDSRTKKTLKLMTPLSIDKLNGFTILRETPIVTRLIVKRDGSHQATTTTNNDSFDNIPATKTTTTTLYKCHLCCCTCPSLHRMRCHLVFHCRKEPGVFKCATFHERPDDHDDEFEITQQQQQQQHEGSQDSTGVLRWNDKYNVQRGYSEFSPDLNKHKLPRFLFNDDTKNLTTQRNHSTTCRKSDGDLKSNVKSETPSPVLPNIERGASSLTARNISNTEKSKDSCRVDSDALNTTAYCGLTGRKRRFSGQAGHSENNLFIAKRSNEFNKTKNSKEFSTEQIPMVNSNFVTKTEKENVGNGAFEKDQTSSFNCFNGESKFRPYGQKDLNEQGSSFKSTCQSPDGETNSKLYYNGLSFNSHNIFSDRCLFPQNGSSFFSPYYWLARQQWFNMAASSRNASVSNRARGTVQGNTESSPKVIEIDDSTQERAKKEENDVELASSLPSTSPLLSPNLTSPISSPSKPSTPSADSSSSPLAPPAPQLYNPLELVKIMHNLSAYPNLLPPVYPFFSMSPSLQNNPLLDPRYANKTMENFTSKHDHLSDSDETSLQGSYPPKSSASQLKMPPTISFDKSLPRSFYSYYSPLNLALPSNYNLQSSKFIPSTDAGATSASPCLSSFSHSQYYKPMFTSDTNYSALTGKVWPSTCDVKPNSDLLVRKESKLSTFIKSDKSDTTKSSAKRGEACRPIKLADGRTVYHCSQCRKTFTNISDVNRHMDFHEDIRPFKCKFCSYYARTNSQLKVHMMRHQGIRQYVCHLCNYKGVTQSDLNRHTKSQIHVLKSRNECTQCSEGFVSPMNLAQHCKDRHHSSVT